MNKVQKIDELIRRLKKDNCKIVATCYNPEKQEIWVRMLDYKNQIVQTTYNLDHIKL